MTKALVRYTAERDALPALPEISQEMTEAELARAIALCERALVPVDPRQLGILGTQLIGSFPQATPVRDPDNFMESFVRELAEYPQWAVMRGCRRAIRTSRFVPAISEVIELVGEEVEAAHRRKRQAEAAIVHKRRAEERAKRNARRRHDNIAYLKGVLADASARAARLRRLIAEGRWKGSKLALKKRELSELNDEIAMRQSMLVDVENGDGSFNGSMTEIMLVEENPPSG